MFTRVNQYRWTRAVQSKVLLKQGYKEFHIVCKSILLQSLESGEGMFSVFCEGGAKLTKIAQGIPSYAEAVKVAADYEANAESERVFARFWSIALLTVAVIIFSIFMLSAI